MTTYKELLLWLPIILVAIPFLIFLVPQYLGLNAYIVESGSMAPGMPTGSVIYTTSPVDTSNLKEGDVIVFTPNQSRISEKRVTHRIVDIKEGNYTLLFKTQGDANEEPDPGWTPSYNIEGKRVFSLPYLGTIIETSQRPLLLIFFVTIPSIILLREELKKLLDRIEEGGKQGSLKDYVMMNQFISGHLIQHRLF